MANKIIIRHDTLTNWTTTNPILSNGELAIVSNSTPILIKCGNGIDHFNDLEYVNHHHKYKHIAIKINGASEVGGTVGQVHLDRTFTNTLLQATCPSEGVIRITSLADIDFFYEDLTQIIICPTKINIGGDIKFKATIVDTKNIDILCTNAGTPSLSDFKDVIIELKIYDNPY